MASILSPIRNIAFARTLDRVVGSPLLYWFGVLRSKRPVPPKITRVGIMMFETIGDTLLAASLIASLRKSDPDMQVIVFASGGNRGVLPLIAGVHAVVEVPLTRPFRAIAAMRSVAVDVMIDIGQWPRWYALMCALSRSGHTIGFATPGQGRHHAYDSTVVHRDDVHELENFQNLLTPLPGVVPVPPALALAPVGPLPHDLMALAPYVVFHPWASGFNFGAREWPLSHWTALARRVCATGRQVLITGGPADAQRAQAWLASCHGLAVKSLAGQCTLTEVAAVLRGADAVVSVNTGVMHLAAVLDVPLVALHGPTSRRRWGPVGARSVALAPPAVLKSEFLNLGFEYPPGAVNVMASIEVDDVFEAMRAHLMGQQPECFGQAQK